MRIVIQLEDVGFADSPDGVWSARCEAGGFVAEATSTDRGDALASVRRSVFAHLAELDQPPRYVDFEVSEKR